MKWNQCEQCPLRAKYDKNPNSLIGRIWRFHIRFCPGWKAYMRSLSDEKRTEIKAKYKL
ncbi:MAG: hypothetical protein N2316_06175 [Spirochaetes bacterium]|nr:hypothetical protein [Spirochaetota bacterium]